LKESKQLNACSLRPALRPYEIFNRHYIGNRQTTLVRRTSFASAWVWRWIRQPDRLFYRVDRRKARAFHSVVTALWAFVAVTGSESGIWSPRVMGSCWAALELGPSQEGDFLPKVRHERCTGSLLRVTTILVAAVLGSAPSTAIGHLCLTGMSEAFAN